MTKCRRWLGQRTVQSDSIKVSQTKFDGRNTKGACSLLQEVHSLSEKS